MAAVACGESLPGKLGAEIFDTQVVRKRLTGAVEFVSEICSDIAAGLFLPLVQFRPIVRQNHVGCGCQVNEPEIVYEVLSVLDFGK
jgi:hypothetical protein